MLLLNSTPGFWQYWPAVIFFGALTIVMALALIFWFIERKEDGKREAALNPNSTTQNAAEPKKPFWQRFKKWLGIKDSDENEVEEYKDRYGSFQTIGIILVVIAIIWILSTISFHFSRIELPQWLKETLKNGWFWVGLAVFILLIIFGSSLFKKRSNWNWKWLWIPALVLIVGFALLRWVIPFIAEKQYRANENNVTTGTIVIKDPLFDSPRLNLNGENKMQKGQFFQFEINYDDPSISFDPKDSEVTVLYCQKKEDPTRKWRMYISKDKEGKKEVRFSPRVPLDKALVGTVYIKSENRDAVVVVSQKEN